MSHPLLQQAAKEPDAQRREYLIRMHLGERLRADVRACTSCGLHETSTQRVPAQYSNTVPKVDVIFVGEAPGRSEDESGKPFVGPAGKLFESLLREVGLTSRQDVWVANTICCRPPGNVYQRGVDVGAVSSCAPFLQRAIALSGAWLIVALGNSAYQALAGDKAEGKIGDVRGKPVMLSSGRVLLPTYHPAYALRQPSARELILSDLRELLDITVTSSSTHIAKQLAGVPAEERGVYLSLWYEARLSEGDDVKAEYMQGRLMTS